MNCPGIVPGSAGPVPVPGSPAIPTGRRVVPPASAIPDVPVTPEAVEAEEEERGFGCQQNDVRTARTEERA